MQTERAREWQSDGEWEDKSKKKQIEWTLRPFRKGCSAMDLAPLPSPPWPNTTDRICEDPRVEMFCVLKYRCFSCTNQDTACHSPQGGATSPHGGANHTTWDAEFRLPFLFSFIIYVTWMFRKNKHKLSIITALISLCNSSVRSIYIKQR